MHAHTKTDHKCASATGTKKSVYLPAKYRECHFVACGISDSMEASLVGVVLTFRAAIDTDLDGLKKSEGCLIYAIINAHTRPKPTRKALEKFDKVFWYDAVPTEESLVNTDGVWVAEIEQILVREILSVWKPELVRLVPIGECLVMMGAKLRQKYHIPGPLPEKMRVFVSKLELKKVAHAAGIAATKYVRSWLNAELESELSRIETALGCYPFFGKPTSGFGSAGSAVIWDRSCLTEFLLKQPNNQHR